MTNASEHALDEPNGALGRYMNNNLASRLESASEGSREFSDEVLVALGENPSSPECVEMHPCPSRNLQATMLLVPDVLNVTLCKLLKNHDWAPCSRCLDKQYAEKAFEMQRKFGSGVPENGLTATAILWPPFSSTDGRMPTDRPSWRGKAATLPLALSAALVRAKNGEAA